MLITSAPADAVSAACRRASCHGGSPTPDPHPARSALPPGQGSRRGIRLVHSDASCGCSPNGEFSHYLVPSIAAITKYSINSLLTPPSAPAPPSPFSKKNALLPPVATTGGCANATTDWKTDRLVDFPAAPRKKRHGAIKRRLVFPRQGFVSYKFCDRYMLCVTHVDIGEIAGFFVKARAFPPISAPWRGPRTSPHTMPRQPIPPRNRAFAPARGAPLSASVRNIFLHPFHASPDPCDNPALEERRRRWTGVRQSSKIAWL